MSLNEHWIFENRKSNKELKIFKFNILLWNSNKFMHDVFIGSTDNLFG